jgi:hypothetical protein
MRFGILKTAIGKVQSGALLGHYFLEGLEEITT